MTTNEKIFDKLSKKLYADNNGEHDRFNDELVLKAMQIARLEGMKAGYEDCTTVVRTPMNLHIKIEVSAIQEQIDKLLPAMLLILP